MAPLRERVEDIPLLMNELISRMEHEKRGSIRFNSASIMSLCRHGWPGNVRELRNTVQRASLLARGERIGVADLGLPAPESRAVSSTSNGDEPDRATIEAALARAGGVVAQAATELGLSRQALYRRLERLGIDRP
jgi:DNA-binding NtrC family response regulator